MFDKLSALTFFQSKSLLKRLFFKFIERTTLENTCLICVTSAELKERGLVDFVPQHLHRKITLGEDFMAGNQKQFRRTHGHLSVVLRKTFFWSSPFKDEIFV